MGICGSSGETMSPSEKAALKEKQKRSKALDKLLAKSNAKEAAINKLLLLGAGESGKSTLFKQMIILYGKGFSKEDRQGYVKIIHGNVLSSMQTLIKQSAILATQKYDTSLTSTLKSSADFINEVKSDGTTINAKLGAAVKELWQSKPIQKTYELRSKFQLTDSANYFFDKIDTIAADEYIPSEQDVLRSRVRTTGIVEQAFLIDGNEFRMFDVGGQRNERKKWIHCFEEVTAVLFVAALSAYDQVLYEDEDTNRMDEALQLFDEICNSRWFKKTSMILFLNKRDLFQEKIRKVPLTVCFDDYDGQNNYQEACNFIQDQFEAKRRNKSKQIYTHITTATDKNNMKIVFNAVKDIVIRKSLADGGLLG